MYLSRIVFFLMLFATPSVAQLIPASQRQLPYRKAPPPARFRILDSQGDVSFRRMEDLMWNKVEKVAYLKTGDLVKIGSDSLVLFQVKVNAKDGKKLVQLLYDQEGIVRLNPNLRREVKVLGNVVQAMSNKKSAGNKGRERSLLSFQSAWSKARVLSFSSDQADNELNLGRLGDSKKAKTRRGSIKIINPSSGRVMDYTKLPKEITVTWSSTSKRTENSKYAVFIWRVDEKPKAPVIITDKSYYVHQIKKPGRFKVKVVDLESGAMSSSNLEFSIFQRGTKLRAENGGEKSPNTTFPDKPRIYGSYPLETDTLVGLQRCRNISFLWEGQSIDNPFYRFSISASEEGLGSKLRETMKMQELRKAGIWINSRSSEGAIKKRSLTKLTESEVVTFSLNPGLYVWQVSLYNPKSGLTLRESREYKVECRASNNISNAILSVLDEQKIFEVDQKVVVGD